MEPLSEFLQLSPLVYFHTPEITEEISHARGPRLILLATWMNGLDIHISRYTSTYQDIYPAATILLVKCPVSALINRKGLKRNVRLAALFIHGLNLSDKPRAELLVHIFSTGGSLVFNDLLEAYSAVATSEDRRTLPLHSTIYDSAPGLFAWTQNMSALTVGQSIVAQFVLYPAYSIVLLWIWMHWSLSVARTRFNEREIIKECRRSYIYSKLDIIIGWQQIESHAKKAIAKGFEVRLEEFLGSKHVSHMPLDKKRYWKIVEETWRGVAAKL